jgi:hypothetical protein
MTSLPQKAFNWNASVTYNEQAKAAFHRVALSRLRRLAVLIGLPKGTYEVRSNKGGIAVSGEITLHGEHIYLQVSQSCMGPGSSILYRTCKGRKDYSGGHNNFAPLSMLDDLDGLASVVLTLLNREGMHPSGAVVHPDVGYSVVYDDSQV